MLSLSSMTKVYLSALGCKLNESELESWARGFTGEGCEIVDSPAKADICVLNTCTVTHVAARKSRQTARQLARANPNARLVLTGCYASTAPEEARALPNVALIVPNAQKDRLVQMAYSILPIADCTISAIPTAINSQPSLVFQSLPLAPLHASQRTRAFVKIQDGCNMSCTYCIIPLARGRESSRPMDEIVSEVNSLVAAGYKEIILTGVQISVYENSGDKLHGLRDLVAAILAETDVSRLRLTSIAPWDLDQSLLDLFSDARLCRHLHLSLQSGCDTVLRRMRRPYTTAQFARAVELAREKIPDVGITTDVIVGFPGESEVEFEQSLRFVEQMGFSRAHVFPYSARAGTLAATLPLHVADAVKDARARQMQAVANASARAFARKFVGRTMRVLWENAEQMSDDRKQTTDTGRKTEDGHPSFVVRRWSGHTDNYIRVFANSTDNLRNQFVPARLIDAADDGAIAALGASMA